MEGAVFDARIRVPSNILISGPTMAGKSTWIINWLDNREKLISKPIHTVLWCSGHEDTKLYENLVTRYGALIKFQVGLPSEADVELLRSRNSMLILDDLMQSSFQSEAVLKLFTQITHHYELLTILVLQNLFASGKHRLTICRNSQYLCLFNNVLDKTIFTILGNRFIPKGGGALLTEILMRGLEHDPYYYIFIDAHVLTSDKSRIRSDIFGTVQRVFLVN